MSTPAPGHALSPGSHLSTLDASALLAQRVLSACTRQERCLLVVDGNAGSGKTTLAALVTARLRDRLPGGVQVLGIDDLVPGWEGLATGIERARRALADLARAAASPPGQREDRRDGAPRPAAGPTLVRVPTWDWERGTAGVPVAVRLDAGGLLVIEGCGALAAAAQDLTPLRTLRVLVDAAEEARRRRIRARDAYSWDLASWQAQETAARARWLGQGQWEPEVRVRTG